MDSPLSEPFEALACLRLSMAHGDWKSVEAIAASVRQHAIPSTPEALGEYLKDLKQTLLAVKLSRANLKVSQVRLNAAAGFGAAALQTSHGRHNSAVSAGF
jgi:hypothetical protein